MILDVVFIKILGAHLLSTGFPNYRHTEIVTQVCETKEAGKWRAAEEQDLRGAHDETGNLILADDYPEELDESPGQEFVHDEVDEDSGYGI